MNYSLCFLHVTIYSLRPGLCIIILPNTMPRRLRSKRMRKSMPATQRSNNTGRGVYMTHKIQDPCLSSQGTLHAPDFNQDLKRDLRSTITSGKCPHSLMPRGRPTRSSSSCFSHEDGSIVSVSCVSPHLTGNFLRLWKMC